MKSMTAWHSPGWPWELEILCITFVIVAIVVPFYIQGVEKPESVEFSLFAQSTSATATDLSIWQERANVFWAIAIAGLYLLHLVMGSLTRGWISTSITHLFSPLLFAGIAYYRLYQLGWGNSRPVYLLYGTWQEMVAWGVAVVFITVWLARIRMNRCMLDFRDEDWILITPTRTDKTFWALASNIRPLIYPPRSYRVSEGGILIVGWLYLLPIAFAGVHSVDPVENSALIVSGNYFAASLHSLVRIKLTENPVPFFISPADRPEFVNMSRGFMRG